MLRLLAVFISPFLLAGCATPLAPTIYLFGSYFPAWLLCGIIGIVGAIVVRVVFIRIGIDDALPLRLLVYVCIALIITLLSSLVFFAH